MAFQLVKGGHPPPHTPAGQQPGFGPIYLAVAHTQYGNIPAKAGQGQCWFPYGGKEHSSHDFSWVVAPGHQLVRNSGFPPPRAIACGFQNDGGATVWGAIAHTQWGDIPGKAIGNNCWFPQGGQENTTNNFSWIVTPSFILARHNMHPNPPPTTPAGNQPGFGPIWCAVAHSPQWGNIPGKAGNGNCWFPYGGKEHSTNDFSWVEVPGHQLVRNTGGQPPNAIVVGQQTQGGGALLCIAIAHTQWGNIPGKAMGNTCWYAQGGQEHTTSDFSWVVN